MSEEKLNSEQDDEESVDQEHITLKEYCEAYDREEEIRN